MGSRAVAATGINNTKVDNAKNIDLLILIHSFIEYGDN